jgi:hypothetical protein
MPRAPRHSPHPWLRSAEESVPRRVRSDRRVTAAEAIAIFTVIAVLVAMVLWFLFFAGGGLGQGTV